MNSDTKIAFVGATGKAGSVIYPMLLAAGFKMNMLCRNSERLQNISINDVSLIHGNALDVEKLDRTLDGCQVVVNCLSNAGNDTPISSIVTSMILGRLCHRSDVRYFCLTGKTVKALTDRDTEMASQERAFLMERYPTIVLDKQKEYDLLTATEVDWTLIRCPLIVDSGAKQYETSATECKGPKVDKRLIGQFIIDELKSRRYVKASPFIYDLE